MAIETRTDLDLILNYLEVLRKIDLTRLSNLMNVPESILLSHAFILEQYGLVELDFKWNGKVTLYNTQEKAIIC